MRGLTVTLTVYLGMAQLVEHIAWNQEVVCSNHTTQRPLKELPPRGKGWVTLIVVN